MSYLNGLLGENCQVSEFFDITEEHAQNEKQKESSIRIFAVSQIANIPVMFKNLDSAHLSTCITILVKQAFGNDGFGGADVIQVAESKLFGFMQIVAKINKGMKSEK